MDPHNHHPAQCSYIFFLPYTTILRIVVTVILGDNYYYDYYYNCPSRGAKCHPRCDISLAHCLLTSQRDMESEKMKNQHFRAKRKIEKFCFLENYLLFEKKKIVRLLSIKNGNFYIFCPFLKNHVLVLKNHVFVVKYLEHCKN